MDKVMRARVSATWYAFGQLDAGAVPSLHSDHAFEFGEFYAGKQGTFFPSVQDAWQEFLAHQANETKTCGCRTSTPSPLHRPVQTIEVRS